MKRWWPERTLPCSTAGVVEYLPAASSVLRAFEARYGSTRADPSARVPGMQEASTAAQRSKMVAAHRTCTKGGDGFMMRHLHRHCSVCIAACAPLSACLNVQQRLCTSPSASSTASTSTQNRKATSEADYQDFFFAQPITQRLAAVTVAKFQLEAQKQQQQQAASSAQSAAVQFMPMFDFVRRVPSLVRDDLFRHQHDVVQWVAASPLLQLVDHEGNVIAQHDAAPATTGAPAADAGSGGGGGAAPLYNPLLHVRVSVSPEWVRRVSESEPLSRAAATTVAATSPQTLSSAGAPSRGLQKETAKVVVQEALMRALIFLDERALRVAALTASQATTNADSEAAGASAGVVGVRRYVPLVDVLRRIHAEADESGPHSLPSAMRETLEALTMETLEQVVKACGIAVTLGRRRGAGADVQEEYPALSAKCLWVVRSGKLPGEEREATFVALRRADDAEPPRFRFVHSRITSASAATNYGGWGSMAVVPTKEDVYEILKYIPVNWGNLGNLNIPAEVRKRHIRCASTQQWYRRQPYYFELRNLCGTVDIRRSIVLHPEAHGFTKEEACEVLELQLATGTANNLVYLDGDGAPTDDGDSPLEKAAVKFLLRVCPTYFAPMQLTAQRYVKKNLSEATMLAIARRRPQDFEELTTRFSDIVLLRRRGGADSSRWRAAFVADLEKYPEDVGGIMALCNRMCPSWDRPEFIYVRLSETEQAAMGGYAGMLRILQRHPTIFRVGKHFVCRADPSDPLTLQEVEPAHNDVTARSLLREENPYASAMDVALVFHYVAPDNEPCTAAYLADCASPAIRCVLPTRIVSVVQQFPRLFACTETSPGVFAIRKLKQRLIKPASRISGVPMPSSSRSSRSTDAPAATATTGKEGDGLTNGATAAAAASSVAENEADLIQMLEEEIAAEEEHLSKDDVIKAVRTLVPDSGVEAPQLLLWASMNVQRAANEYFGGVLKLVEALPQHFRVVTTEDTKMIYKV